ncbi:serine hydrolase-like protein 2 isoform X3 [Halichoerus grypus]|uniref:serine hydrolase-like protein 2 isoform X2 n=1 Tax=Halichoerus grypus TaxID=9711 RepID=UPI00165964BF|nr:serine hydrolase-like protein 2 isoform X2 [Halichoerus grypus]
MGDATRALPAAHPPPCPRPGAEVGAGHGDPRKGLFSELKLAVPWGHIAAKAWGSQQAPPVLCLHGWLDNANSFDRLIPLLPKDFHYVAMDFGGHGLSSHYSPGLPYYQENFVSDIRRVVAALKWKRFSIVGHSFGGVVGGMGVEDVLTYRRGAIEHMLQVEASQKPRQVLSPEEMLQRFLKNNSHVSEECARLLLQRGTTEVAAGLIMNRDRRMALPEYSMDFISRELFVHSAKKLQAHVLLLKAIQGYYNVRRENDSDRNVLLFVMDTLQSVLKERFQYVEVPDNHYVHLNQPQNVAGFISAFLLSKETAPHEP